MNTPEKTLDYNFWHACAGGMIQLPPIHTKVFYFPQGHAEHAASSNINFNNFPRIPPYVLCELSSVHFMADPQTDEVYAKMKLTPLQKHNDFDSLDEPEPGPGPGFGFDQNPNRNHEVPLSFTKTLTQSDANNGGGFSVPRYCAETIFPALDYTRDPPVQTILAKDVHGKIWKFRHIYRGTPRRHLLTTGWSGFVNNKNLLAGDSVVFLRGEDGCLRVGIRRAKRGFCGVVKDDGLVMKAVSLAVSGEPFEVFYYPRAGTPEFCVTGSSVVGAMRVKWCSGMRFKMAFETEDCCRISWFMGTVCSVNVGDRTRWPESPWRMLQVSWDEPDLLQNVKCVNPWLVEMVPSVSATRVSPPRKKPRLPQPPDFPLISSLNTNSNNNIPTSIQGARHNDSQNNYYNHNQYFPFGTLNNHSLRRFPTTIMEMEEETNENVSCLLTMGIRCEDKHDVGKNKRKPVFMLFGQPILTEQQLSESWSGDGSVVFQNGPVECSSDEAGPWHDEPKTESGIETRCKVLVDSSLYGF